MYVRHEFFTITIFCASLSGVVTGTFEPFNVVQTLVLVENIEIRSSHSLFFDDLEGVVSQNLCNVVYFPVSFITLATYYFSSLDTVAIPLDTSFVPTFCPVLFS